MAAAVSKIMRLQDLIAIGGKCRVTTAFRNTIGLPGRLSVRLQPNHPVDDPRGVAASTLDGLLLGAGDAVVGVNPATDSVERTSTLLKMLDEIRSRYDIRRNLRARPRHHHAALYRAGRPGRPGLPIHRRHRSGQPQFGCSLDLLQSPRRRPVAQRGAVGDNLMYFETGQGSALSADAHHGVDQQTIEAALMPSPAPSRRCWSIPSWFHRPEYLYDGKQIIRAGLEDHFCGKLLGLPMGVDVCYTNHAEADQDDMDALLTLLGVAGVTYVMGVPAPTT